MFLIFGISLVVILVSFLIAYCLRSGREISRLKTQIEMTEKSVEHRVKERTKHLENTRDSISEYAVQKYELAEELEASNRLILEQKDFAARQSEQLRKAYEEIKMLVSFRQLMVRMMIHDLKNPLNVIMNLVDNDGFPDGYRGVIKKTSFEMLELIHNILEVQRFEEMKMQIRLDSINLRSQISSIVEKYLFLFKGSSVELKTSISESHWIRADTHLVNRIFSNLLSNAVKYTPAGGKVEIISSLNDGEILLEIADTGNGIPEENIGNLFQMFSQVEIRESLYNSSTGIGLAYCKYAIDSMGGKIGISSEPGKGTKVWFSLPAIIDRDNPSTRKSSVDVEVRISTAELTEEDIVILRPYIEELRALDIFEISTILEVTGRIALIRNERIIKWKELVEETLYAANEKRFRDLTSVC